MSKPSYDVIVLGVGGFGSSTLYHLARRGVRALGIERFGIAHDRGSSHGQTRVIRKAYFEHPDYVPLLHRAYELWHALEGETGRRLFHQVGLFLAGRPETELVAGTLLAARLHNLPVDKLSAAEARQRFPAYRFADDFDVVFEQQAGYLEVERCVAAHIDAARARGAQLLLGETVLGWSSASTHVTVRTERGEYSAARLVITAGPWAAQALSAGVNAEERNDSTSATPWARWLNVVRKPAFWFPAGDAFEVSAGNPMFFFEIPGGQFYGFPRLDGRSIKVSEHTGGDPVADPLIVDRTQHESDLARVAAFLEQHLPTVSRKPLGHSVCMYTRSPDSHFLIDTHPQFSNVIVGAGFSGHGFKFTSVIGEALAGIALDGQPKLAVDFLSLRRLAAR